MKEETIVAIATAMGEGSIGILRLSGPEALRAGQTLFVSTNEKNIENPEPRKMIYGKIRDPKSGEYIDEALFVYMPGPHSYTAEDVVELHLHGSTQSLQLTLLSITYYFNYLYSSFNILLIR
jgi:tRNA modification GTPase